MNRETMGVTGLLGVLIWLPLFMPAKALEERERTVNFPQDRVFAALKKSDASPSFFERLCDGDANAVICLPVGDSLAQAIGRSSSAILDSTFADGQVTVSVEPDHRLAIRVRAVNDDTIVRIDVDTEEDSTGTATLFKPRTTLASNTLSVADRAEVESYLAVIEDHYVRTLVEILRGRV